MRKEIVVKDVIIEKKIENEVIKKQVKVKEIQVKDIERIFDRDLFDLLKPSKEGTISLVEVIGILKRCPREMFENWINVSREEFSEFGFSAVRATIEAFLEVNEDFLWTWESAIMVLENLGLLGLTRNFLTGAKRYLERKTEEIFELQQTSEEKLPS